MTGIRRVNSKFIAVILVITSLLMFLPSALLSAKADSAETLAELNAATAESGVQYFPVTLYDYNQTQFNTETAKLSGYKMYINKATNQTGSNDVWNSYVGSNNGVTQGIVNRSLVGGNIQFKFANAGFFSGSTDNVTNTKTVYNNVQFPLKQDINGYYVFDSKTDKATFDYSNKINVGFNSQSNGDFFPFDKSGSSRDYYFGMNMGVNFQTKAYGTLNGQEDGTPITFDFSGDDDVWIFIDNTLALDLGGIHDTMSGSINFKDKQIKVDRVYKTINDSYATTSNSNQSQIINFSDLGLEDINDGHIHTLQIFYMERGANKSNLKLKFNLPQTSALAVSKQFVNGDPDTEFTFQAHVGDNDTSLGVYKNKEFTLFEDQSAIGTGTTDNSGKFTLQSGQKAVFYQSELVNKYFKVKEFNNNDVDYDTTWSVSSNGTTLTSGTGTQSDACRFAPSTTNPTNTYNVDFVNTSQDKDLVLDKTAEYIDDSDRYYYIYLTVHNGQEVAALLQAPASTEVTGDADPDDTDDTDDSDDSGSGDIGSGDSGSGDSGSGDIGSGDIGSGDSGSGDIGSGDSGSGDSSSGDSGSGDIGSGDIGSGDSGSDTVILMGAVVAPVDKGAITATTITDVIDPRFRFVEIEDCSSGDDPDVTENGDDTTTIQWTDQTISSTEDWTATIKIQARADFLGGNDIPTNVSDPSCVVYDKWVNSTKTPDTKLFPQPTVNVPFDFDFDVEDTDRDIFYGDSVPTDGVIDDMFDEASIEDNYNWYGKEETGTFEYKWFDEDNTEIPALQNEYPYRDTDYTLEVSFVPNPANPALGSSGPVQDDEIISNSGTYTVNVVRGSIEVTKNINSSETNLANGDPIFVFKLERMDASGENVLETSYENVRFSDKDTTSLKAQFENLKKGIYRVSELDTIRYELDSVDNVSGCNGDIIDDTAAIFYVGYTDEDDSTTNVSNKKGNVRFTNSKFFSKYFSDTDVKKNSFSIVLPTDSRSE